MRGDVAGQVDEDAPATERIEVGGIAGGLSLAALRSVLDPAERAGVTIDLDLSQIRVSIPATALQEILARAMPNAAIDLRDDGLTVRPGGGSPGLSVSLPGAGVRVRIGSAGLQVESD